MFGLLLLHMMSLVSSLMRAQYFTLSTYGMAVT